MALERTMNPPLEAHSLAIDLNQPGTYLHWSIFTVSVANLVLIAVMVVIFGGGAAAPVPQGAPQRARPGRAGRG